MATKTFAQEAKTITNRYKLRLGEKFDKGDSLALEAMNAELTALRDRQESVREKELITEVEKLAKGGLLPKLVNGGFSWGEGGTTETFTPHAGGGEGEWTSAPTVAADPLSTPVGEGFTSRVPWIGAAASAIGGLMSNRKLDLPSFDYEEYDPQEATANLVDYTRGREQTMRERDQANALITRGAASTGSQAGLMENILAGVTGTQRAAGEAFNQSLENEGNVNAQIKNQVSQFNAAQEAQAAQMNTRNKLYANQLDRESVLFNDQRKQNRIGAVTGAVTGYAKDKIAANQYDQMINMMAPDNYKIGEGRDSLFRRIFQISPDMKIDFKNTGDTAL